MLRINLLPAYVTQRRLTKRLSVFFVALFILCVALPLVGYVSMKTHLNDVLQQADTAEAKKKATDDLKTLAATTIAQVAPIQAKLDFVAAVHKNPRDWVKLYNTLADTSPKSSFIYTDAAVSGATMSIKAYSPSVEEVGRYLQAMYHEPDFQTVAVDHVPGYPDNVRNLYYLNGTLVFADGASSSSGSSGGSSSSGYPGSSGSPGGYPGSSGGTSSSSSGYPGSSSGSSSGGSSGGPAGFDPQHLAANGPSNIPTGVGPPPSQLTGGAPSGGSSGPSSSGGYPGGQSGGGQSTGGYSPAFLKIADRYTSPFASPEVQEQIRQAALRRVVRKTVPKGFDINVTATLKQPISPPTLPGAAPAPSGPGGRPGFGSPGGSPGGMGSRTG